MSFPYGTLRQFVGDRRPTTTAKKCESVYVHVPTVPFVRYHVTKSAIRNLFCDNMNGSQYGHLNSKSCDESVIVTLPVI